jgi:hypothetical protein
MNFAQMLMTRVTPLSEYGTAGNEPAYKQKCSKPMRHANEAKRAQTVEKYRAAMRGEWTTTTVIARRLGYVNSASCHGTLVEYEQLGLLERRFAGEGEFNRRKGYEWRFK